MPQQNQKTGTENGTPGTLIVAIVALLAAIALSTGYYFYSQNQPKTPSFPNTPPLPPTQQEPVAPTPTTPEPVVIPPPTTTVTPTISYLDWKTYTYRAPAGGGFTIKYPPGYAVGQERTKEEAYFTIFPSPNPLNKPEVMRIYFEGSGNIRFEQHDATEEWPFYNQVVQSFQKLK